MSWLVTILNVDRVQGVSLVTCIHFRLHKNFQRCSIVYAGHVMFMISILLLYISDHRSHINIANLHLDHVFSVWALYVVCLLLQYVTTSWIWCWLRSISGKRCDLSSVSPSLLINLDHVLVSCFYMILSLIN